MVDGSSYLDLSPLYGNNAVKQRAVRTGTGGKLRLDAFSEFSLLSCPPGVAALLCCFHRFHNYAADQLAILDENGRFSSPNTKEGAIFDQDEKLFQTARLYVIAGVLVKASLKYGQGNLRPVCKYCGARIYQYHAQFRPVPFKLELRSPVPI